MNISEKLSEIEIHYNYWVGNYKRQELITNNVRIVAESICKAVILKKKSELLGTNIILGKNSSIPKKRIANKGGLIFAELILVLQELNIFHKNKAIELQLELIRSKTNPSSHSSNSIADDTSLDDLEICNTSIKPILKWLYNDILEMSIPSQISEGFKGKEFISDVAFSDEKWNEFEMACSGFDKKRFQYILISPNQISMDTYSVQAIARLPWRLVLDFNPRTDENENGLLYNFNKVIGQGYKKAFTVHDKIEFDPNFHHYWFLANGQGNISVTADYKSWKNQYKRFISETLFKAFIKGSRIKSRIVVLLNIDPFYAEDIIEEFNRLDEQNLQFILCSENETYETIFQKIENVKLLKTSIIDIANGINNSVDFEVKAPQDSQILIPHMKEDKKVFISLSEDHYDYLQSLNLEVVYKGIEKTITSDDDNSFFRGSTITWRDLSEQKDIIRNTISSIQKRLDAKLIDNKLEEIQLVHEAGAGGTTLARRIAFNFSVNYPTVLLHKYVHKKTIDGLRIIYDQYTKGSLPLLIILESFEVKESHSLYRDLSNAKKNAVILIIHRGVISNATNKSFILKAQLEGSEVNAFESSYILQAPEAKGKIRSIPQDFKDQPKYISPVLYALTAFGKDYNGLENYVLKCIEGITFEQKKLTGFICLIYYYTQKSVPVELFSSLFNVDRSKCNLITLLGKDNPLFELLHQEADDDEYYNIWRPRYAILGEEAMMVILAGGAEYKKNWKTYLARWLIDLIKYIKLSSEYLDEDTAQIFNSLFIERSYFDSLDQDKEFTRTINDLGTPNDGVAIFETLTSAYPNEAYFHGHFARYIYSGKVGIKNYEKAIEEAELSLDIYPDNSSLLHTLGMCYREKAESLIYTFAQQGIGPLEAEENVMLLTEEACDIFDDCIEKDSYNIYGYESQIRVILKTLDFGFKIHQALSKESFITNPKNSWYAEKLDKVSRLLEEALYVIEQSKKLDKKERIDKSAGYIYDCEAIFFRTLGKHLMAKSRFEDLVKNTPSGYEYMRPHYRRMFVMCLLASKSRDQKDLFVAWSGISESELNQCVQYLDANIFEDPNNTQNIRLWLQAIRYVKNPPELVSCISKIGSWTQVSKQNYNSILEGYYYLYVLNSIKAISEGNTFDPTSIQIVKEVQEKMKPFMKNEKFCYEWFGSGSGVQQMVNHKKLGEFTVDFFEKNKNIISKVTGRIKSINSSQQGSIILDCGLEAFFVPNVGGFTERNINERVKFYVGFRYDQIQAWSVTLITSNKDIDLKKQAAVELKDLIDDIESEEKITNVVSMDLPLQEKVELPKLTGLTLIGKIDLVDNHKISKKIKSGEFYFGKIKLLKNETGYISCSDLDKDIAFNKFHLQDCSFSELNKDDVVKFNLNMVNTSPKSDASDRNYLAKDVFLNR